MPVMQVWSAFFKRVPKACSFIKSMTIIYRWKGLRVYFPNMWLVFLQVEVGSRYSWFCPRCSICNSILVWSFRFSFGWNDEMGMHQSWRGCCWQCYLSLDQFIKGFNSIWSANLIFYQRGVFLIMWRRYLQVCYANDEIWSSFQL